MSVYTKNAQIFQTSNPAGLVVSKACGEVMRKLRLGENQVTPLVVYDGLGEDTGQVFFFLNLCERRIFSAPEYCNSEKVGLGGDDYTYRLDNLYEAMTNDSIAVKSEALDSDLDIWIDPLFDNNIFLSHDLYTALAEIEVERLESWMLASCKLV